MDWNKKDENMKSSHDKDPRSVSSLSVLKHTKESTKLAFNDNDGDKEEEDPLRRRSRRRRCVTFNEGEIFFFGPTCFGEILCWKLWLGEDFPKL